MSAVAALVRRWDDAMSALDAAGAAAFATDDVEYVDHRGLGWEPVHGRDQLEAWFGTMMAGVEVFRVRSEIVEARGPRLLLRQTAWFRAPAADGGGEAEIVLYVVVLYRGDLVARADIFEDEPAGRAAMS